jgi:hypothetical protein
MELIERFGDVEVELWLYDFDAAEQALLDVWPAPGAD